MKVTIFGGGGWGTALAVTLADLHEDVWLYVRRPEQARDIAQRRQNRQYLPEILLPDSVVVTDNVSTAIADCSLLILTTPSQGVREAMRVLSPLLPVQTIVVSAAKGLEFDSGRRMTEVILQENRDIAQRLAVLSGPNHAEEVGRKIPSAAVIACTEQSIAEWIQDALMTPCFRVYTQDDVIGVELAGALKNIIAIATGIADGLGFGDNTRAALMTRGLTEIARLGAACGADMATFMGLAGVGDLVATCTSPHSRNRRAGLALAAGKNIADIQSESGMVVEGVRATAAACILSMTHKVEMPIVHTLQAVLQQRLSTRDAVESLMTRHKKHEQEVAAFSFFPGRGV